MKRKDIIVGHKYTNNYTTNLRAIREVIGVGPEFVLYPGQADTDCVRYRLLAKGRTGTGATLSGKEYHTTRAAFAYWAVRDITEEK